ncbi:MAG: hydroxyacid dehydrogenase [Lentisphaerae bacterium]|jgi:phosphoglycerate dehydrogenase-like enzyme|nr:hydroxyacid dehydrogenase [Lentisphaerota bacterium]
MAKPKGLFVLESSSFEKIYGAELYCEVGELVDLPERPLTAAEVLDDLSLLEGCEILFSGWGAPVLDGNFMTAASELKVFLYGAGSVRYCVTEASWLRGVRVCSAVAANAVPVAEYTLGTILLGLKRFWHQAQAYRDGAGRCKLPGSIPGGYGSTVGLVSLGTIGRLVCQLLRNFDVKVVAYDPFVTTAEAEKLGVELVALGDVFALADVVSIHAPNLAETKGMITGEHIRAMRPGAVLINTARGAVVCEDEMAEVLAVRSDLWAILDVTIGENLVADAPLMKLPNVVRTPHIAGSQDGECRRMGRYMVDELRRYLNNEPLQHEITRERAEIMA